MSKERKIDKEGSIEKNDYYLKYRFNLFGVSLDDNDNSKYKKHKLNENDLQSVNSNTTTTPIRKHTILSSSSYSFDPSSHLPLFISDINSHTSISSFSSSTFSQDSLTKKELSLKDIGLSNFSSKELNLFYIYACKLCGTISSQPLNPIEYTTYDDHYKKLFDDLFINKQDKYILFISKTKKEILNEMRSELSELLLAITQVYYF